MDRVHELTKRNLYMLDKINDSDDCFSGKFMEARAAARADRDYRKWYWRLWLKVRGRQLW